MTHKIKNHWTATKKRAAHIIDMHRGELADMFLEIVGDPEPKEGDRESAMWYIPEKLEIDIRYLFSVDGPARDAAVRLEDEIQDAISRFLEATE